MPTVEASWLFRPHTPPVACPLLTPRHILLTPELFGTKVAMKVSGCVEGKGLDRQEFVRAVQAALEGGR